MSTLRADLPAITIRRGPEALAVVRALARLVLLTEADPQFRRNRERINRDAERELISLEWDLGRPDQDFEE